MKTGYTNLAELCLVASARRDDRPLIGVVLGSDDAVADQSFVDTIRMFEYGYTAFIRPVPAGEQERVTRYRWHDEAVRLVAAEELGKTVPVGSRARWRVMVDPFVERPVPAGAELGRAELIVGGDVVDATPLISARDVPAGGTLAPPVAAGAAVEETIRAFARLYEVRRDV